MVDLDAIMSQTYNESTLNTTTKPLDCLNFLKSIKCLNDDFSIINKSKLTNKQDWSSIKKHINNTQDNTTHDFFVIDDNIDIFSYYKRVILIDNAGSGKSTIVKFLINNLIKNCEYTPIFIQLKDLRPHRSIFKSIIDIMSSNSQRLSQNALDELLEYDEKTIIFFEGFDEIPQCNKNSIIKELHNFINLNPNIFYFITSREDERLYSFSGFSKFSIDPLTHEQTYTLLAKYDNFGEISNELIKVLVSIKNNDAIHELLKNPLTASLLYVTYRYNREIPLNKVELYEYIYYALFTEHDCTKPGVSIRDKISNLDIDEFKELLSYIAFTLYGKNSVEYKRDTLVKTIKDYADKKQTTIHPDLVIEDLCKSISLFSKIGQSYTWVHKSFQEYFFTYYVVNFLKKKKAKNLIKQILSNSQMFQDYFNSIDLILNMDKCYFDSIAVRPFIKSFIKTYEESKKITSSLKMDTELVSLLNTIPFYVHYLSVSNITKYGLDNYYISNTGLIGRIYRGGNNEDPTTTFSSLFITLEKKIVDFIGLGNVNYSNFIKYLISKDYDLFKCYSRSQHMDLFRCQSFEEFVYSLTQTEIVKVDAVLSSGTKSACLFLLFCFLSMEQSSSYETKPILDYYKCKCFITEKT